MASHARLNTISKMAGTVVIYAHQFRHHWVILANNSPVRCFVMQ